MAFSITAIALAGSRLTPGNVDVETIRKAISVILAGDFTLEPASSATILFMVLPQFLAFVFLAWWHDLDLVVRARQPWAGLSSPAPAHLNLTLNYLDGHGHLWKALANKHYVVVFLYIGSVLSLLLPIVTAGIFRLETASTLLGDTQGTRNFTWNTRTPSSLKMNVPEGIPASAIDAVLRPPGDIRWVLRDHAVLPVVPDVTEESASNLPLGTFWRASTESLHSRLKCTLLRDSAVRHTAFEELPIFPNEAPTLDVALPPGIFFEDGTTNYSLKTCDRTRPSYAVSESQTKTLCYRWDLQSIRATDQSRLRPGWIVSMAGGFTNHRSRSSGQEQDRVEAYLCEPEAYTSTGTAEVVEIFDSASGSILPGLREFRPEREEKLDSTISWAFSHMLNRSMHAGDGNETNISVPQDLIESKDFAGDLMGYLLYRSLLLSPGQGLAAVSSLYSRLFAYTSFIVRLYYLTIGTVFFS